jgi:hypothetical protein
LITKVRSKFTLWVEFHPTRSGQTLESFQIIVSVAGTRFALSDLFRGLEEVSSDER